MHCFCQLSLESLWSQMIYKIHKSPLTKLSKASREPVVYSVGMYKLCSSQPAQKIILIKKLCNGDALNCTTFGSGH